MPTILLPINVANLEAHLAFLSGVFPLHPTGNARAALIRVGS